MNMHKRIQKGRIDRFIRMKVMLLLTLLLSSSRMAMVIAAAGNGAFGLEAAQDTFVRGGQYRNQPYGNAHEITIKTHYKPSMERIGLIQFTGVKAPGNTIQVMLTVSTSSYSPKSSKVKPKSHADEIVLCNMHHKWQGDTVTYETHDTERDLCVFAPISPYLTPGDSFCYEVPATYVEAGQLSLEVSLLPRSSSTKELTQSSDSWVSFASLENNDYLPPRILDSAAACTRIKAKPVKSTARNCNHGGDAGGPGSVATSYAADKKGNCFFEYGAFSFFKSPKAPQHGSQNQKRALVYSPYDLSLGGGEKYLLEVVAFFITSGYQVALITHDTNYCKTKDCVLQTAHSLRVDLSESFAYLPLTHEGLKKAHEQTVGVDVYYEMGNGRFPEFPNPASLGIYQCQFPFDLYGPYSEQKVQRLSSFQLVILNSQYTKSWYANTMEKPLEDMELHGLPYPTLEILFPPVTDPSDSTRDALSSSEAEVGTVIHIAMVGRIFSGRQNKGHLQGIQALSALNRRVHETKNSMHTFELHIIGNVQPGFESYSEQLRALATSEAVQFHLGVGADELKSRLSSCQMIWHLTGMDQMKQGEQDPASFEHFGISVVEGMLLGLHPIVMNAGGLPEAVGKHGDRVNTLQELVDKSWDSATAQAQLSREERAEQIKSMKKHAQDFLQPTFKRRLDRIIVRARRSNRFHRKFLPSLPYSCSSSKDMVQLAKVSTQHLSGYMGAAFIYIHSFFWHAKMTTRNVMNLLGPGWQLVIAHPIFLESYAHMLARGVYGPSFKSYVKFMPLDIDTSTTDAYSALLLSTSFWQDIKYEHVFIFQSDAALLKNPTSFLRDPSANVPFVGAPWCTTNEIFSSRAVDSTNGNGGLSYRSNSFAQRCIGSSLVRDEVERKRKLMKGTGQAHFMMNEDLYFSVCTTTLMSPQEVTAIESVGKTFAVEVPCSPQSLDDPAGLHATWYYVSESTISHLVNTTRWRLTEEGHALQACRK